MSEPIKTERYRLALIAHHAEKMAELLRDGKDCEGSFSCIADILGVSVWQLELIACYINNHLNKDVEK